MKKGILLAAMACVAMFALPAVASANVWHIDKAVHFGGGGGAATLSDGSTAGTVHCTTSTVTGAYETTTTGWVEFTFHGCKSTAIFSPSCTSGVSAGTIETTKLTFHNVVLGGVPSILITPNDQTKTFAHFSCFGISATVAGNGILGTTDQECEGSAETATVSFNVVEGKQEHTVHTGTTYGLESSTGGGEYKPATESASGTIEFAGGEARTATCT